MTRRLLALLAICSGPFALGCFGSPPGSGSGNGPGSGDPAADPACQLDSKGEKTPGYPYNVDKFTNDVLPIVAKSCGTAGCHGAPTGTAGFTVWADAAVGNCNYGKTFNQVVAKIDLATPANSQLLSAINGGDASHPIKLAADAPEIVKIKGFIDDGAKTFANAGGGQTAPPGPSPYDYAVFQSQVQPAIDKATCAKAGCHGTGAGGFTLKATPAANSDDMKANFIAVTSRGNLDSPDQSVIYVRATVAHAGGASTQVDATGAQQMLAWITAAKAAAGTGGGGGGNPSCAPVNLFNAGVFRSEILPILSGDLDLNAVDGVGHGAGCMSGACHGTDRGPGTLSLVPTADTGTQLQNFACFVNLTNPTASEIISCPNGGACRRSPHPGQDVFGGANDLNFQRVLAYLYGVKANVSPFDFAFFVRRINPIFNDNNSVEKGAQGRSCSDTTACHGISVVGQSAPNGSDFPIIANASDETRLTVNFVAATGFVNFLNPGESSLILYPTNEIADRANHPFATGLPHPGGEDFLVTDIEAQTILQWAQGLRPDGQGFQRNWLVAGDFAASLISDPTIIDEATVTPKIFDQSGGAFNIGQWDGLFSDSKLIDLNTVFPRNATSGRVGYAASYVVNTAPRDQLAEVVVNTTNPIRIYVDGKLVAQNDNSGGATALVQLKAAGTPNVVPPRILIKLLQRANDAKFAFSAQLKDELGNLLTDVNGGLVFTLGPNGGI